MTALVQGSAGIALVMGFALLGIRQVSAAFILLAIQSVAVALAAIVLHRPMLAFPTVVLIGGAWFTRELTRWLDPQTEPVGGAKLGIAAGAVLAVLSQSLGSLALPMTVVLLSVLLAATRPHPLMRVMALAGIQNGVVLAACLAAVPEPPHILAAACLALPLPLAAGLLIPAVTQRAISAPVWEGWADVALALAVLGATLIVPLDPIATLFAPLLALDGVVRSVVRRKRRTLTLPGRGLALLNGVCLLLAVCAPNQMLAWLAILGAAATSLLPTLGRRWDDAALAFIGAGIALFGLLLVPTAQPVAGYFSLFAGLATVAAVVPDLAVIAVVIILRFATTDAWPPAVEALGAGIALVALLACAALLLRGRHRTTLLVLSQASIATLAICLGQAEGRFAALIMLILLIATRSAARVQDRFVSTLATAGLGGVPPLTLFPGLALIVLAIAGHAAWMLLPFGAAMIPIVLASLPAHLPRASIRSIGWLPLAVAIVAGYFTPEGLSQWLHMLTVR